MEFLFNGEDFFFFLKHRHLSGNFKYSVIGKIFPFFFS